MFNQLDIFDLYESRFSEKAKKALAAAQATGVIHQYNEFAGEWIKKTDPSPLQKAYASLFAKSPNPKQNFIDTLTRLLDIEPMYTRKIAQVRFLGVKIEDSSKREKSIDRLISKINEYAEQGFIMGNMTKLIEIKLGSLPGQPVLDHSVVVSYIIMNDAGVAYMDAQKDNLEIKEGQMPKSLED